MLANRLRWIHWGLIPVQLTICTAVVLHLSHAMPLAYYVVLPNAYLIFLGWSANHLWRSRELEDGDYHSINNETYRRHVAGITGAWICFFVSFAFALVVTAIALRNGQNYFGLRYWCYLAAFGTGLDAYKESVFRLTR